MEPDISTVFSFGLSPNGENLRQAFHRLVCIPLVYPPKLALHLKSLLFLRSSWLAPYLYIFRSQLLLRLLVTAFPTQSPTPQNVYPDAVDFSTSPLTLLSD